MPVAPHTEECRKRIEGRLSESERGRDILERAKRRRKADEHDENVQEDVGNQAMEGATPEEIESRKRRTTDDVSRSHAPCAANRSHTDSGTPCARTGTGETDTTSKRARFETEERGADVEMEGHTQTQDVDASGGAEPMELEWVPPSTSAERVQGTRMPEEQKTVSEEQRKLYNDQLPVSRRCQ